MLCAGHPEWDPKRPGKNVEAIEKWDKYHEDAEKKKRQEKVKVWKDTPITKGKNKPKSEL